MSKLETLLKLADLVADETPSPTVGVMPDRTGQIVMVRSRDAATCYGVLVARNGREVSLKDARRVWQWDGAFTLSALATLGTSKPSGCRFSARADIDLLEACEIIPMTGDAVASLDKVKDHVG